MAHALYDRYPFDSHIMVHTRRYAPTLAVQKCPVLTARMAVQRILLSFPDPYTFIQPKERLDWGMVLHAHMHARRKARY